MSNPLIPANLNTGANSVSAAGALGIVQTAQMMAFPVDSSGLNQQGLRINRGSKKSIMAKTPKQEKIKVGPGTQRELPQNLRIDKEKNLRSEYFGNRRQRRLSISSQRRLLQKNNPSHLNPEALSEVIRPENRHDQSSRAQHIRGQQASLSELFSQKESIIQNSFYECAMSINKDKSLYTLSLFQDFDPSPVFSVDFGARASINSVCSFTLTDELLKYSYNFNITKLQDFSHPDFTFNEQRTNCTRSISNGIYFKIQQESNGLLSFGYCQSDGAFFLSCVYSENSDILRQVTTSTPPAKGTTTSAKGTTTSASARPSSTTTASASAGTTSKPATTATASASAGTTSKPATTSTAAASTSTAAATTSTAAATTSAEAASTSAEAASTSTAAPTTSTAAPTTSTTPTKAVFSCNSTVSGFEIFNDDNNEQVVKLSLERNLANASFYENLISFDSEKKLILRDEYGNNYVFNERGYTTSNAFTRISSSADSIIYSLQDAKCRNYILTFNLTQGAIESAIIIDQDNKNGIRFNIDESGKLNSQGIIDGRISAYCFKSNLYPAYIQNCSFNEEGLKRSLVYEFSNTMGEKKEFSVEITKRDNQFKNLSLAINFSGSYLGLSLNPNSSIQENFNLINQTIAKKGPSLGFLAKLEDNKIVFYGRYDGLEIKLNLRKKDDNLFEFEFENEERTCDVLSESNDVLKDTTTTIQATTTTTQLTTTTPPRTTTSRGTTTPALINQDITCEVVGRVMKIYNSTGQEQVEIKLIKDPKNTYYTKSVNFKIGDEDFIINYDNVTFGDDEYGDDVLSEANITFGDRWLLKKTGENSYEISKDNLKITQEYEQEGQVKIRATNNNAPILNCDFDNQGNITKSLSCTPASVISSDSGVTTKLEMNVSNTVYIGTTSPDSLLPMTYLTTTPAKFIKYLSDYCSQFQKNFDSSSFEIPSLLPYLNELVIADQINGKNESELNSSHIEKIIKTLKSIDKNSTNQNISNIIEKLESCKNDKANGPDLGLAIGLAVGVAIILAIGVISYYKYQNNEAQKLVRNERAQNQANGQENQADNRFLPEGEILRVRNFNEALSSNQSESQDATESGDEVTEAGSGVTEPPEAESGEEAEVELVDVAVTGAESGVEAEAEAARLAAGAGAEAAPAARAFSRAPAGGVEEAGGVGFGKRNRGASTAPEVTEVATRTTGRAGTIATQLRQTYRGSEAPRSLND